MSGPSETENPETPFWRKVVRRAGILTGTALVGALAVGAVILGSQVIAQNSVRIAVEGASEPLTVRVVPVRMQDNYSVPQHFIGMVEPRQSTQLGFESGGTLAAITVDEGDGFAAGDVLARLDTRSLEAQLAQQKAARDALAAQLELARLTSERQKTLADRSYASQQRADEARLTVAELEARIAEADATITGTEVQIDKAVLRAPYDGRVAARYVDAGARVTASAPVLELQEDASPRLRIGLLPELAMGLAPGDQIDVTIAGYSFTARFHSRRAGLDATTRTLPALFDLDPTAPSLPYGATVDLTVDRDVDDRGTWLPLSALTEGPRGLWTVLLVDDSGDVPRVAMESVVILYADEDRAFVRGALNDGLLVIAEGTHRVAVGQPVRTTAAG